MSIGDIAKTSLRPFRTRGLESALIVLAVALGVSVVTAMLALVLNGFEQERSLQESLRARELILISRDQDNRAFSNGANLNLNPLVKIGKSTDPPFKFELSDLETIRRACPAVAYAYVTGYVGIEMRDTGDDASRRNEIQLTGVSREYREAAGLTLVAGSWPTETDYKSRRNVIVVTDWFVRQRFGNLPEPESSGKTSNSEKPVQSSIKPTRPFEVKDAIGKTIEARGGLSFKIIGVFAGLPRGQEFAAGGPFGSKGIIPFGQRMGEGVGATELIELRFSARADQFDAAREQLRAYATRRYGAGAAVFNARQQIAADLSTARSAALVTALFASGGLVIAALNIMNLMLARVLGRTRSIGISSALGATSRTIFGLFLTESLALGALGGLLGVLLARGIAYGLEVSLRGAGQYSGGMDFTIRPVHFVIGLFVALVVSLLFGAYPAWMAAQVRPSEALRG
jgi:ABC-type antimicrobial peptide transport system permease subunit